LAIFRCIAKDGHFNTCTKYLSSKDKTFLGGANIDFEFLDGKFTQ